MRKIFTVEVPDRSPSVARSGWWTHIHIRYQVTGAAPRSSCWSWYFWHIVHLFTFHLSFFVAMCANKLRSDYIRTSKAIFKLLLSWKTFRYPAPIGHLLSPYPATTRRSARRSAEDFLRRSSSLFLRGLASVANFLFYICLFWFLNGRTEVLVKIPPSPCWGDFPGIIDRGLIKKGQQ